MTDLLLLWEWPWDASFVTRVQRAALKAGLRAETHGRDDMAACLDRLLTDDAFPFLLMDRASDVMPEAKTLAENGKQKGVRVINDPDRAVAAVDKARMHLALMSVGVNVPWTLFLSPDQDVTTTDRDALQHLGTPFVIKPAHGGGGDGVVLAASTLQDIAQARGERAEDTVLVQENIVPADFDGRPAYFRVIHCLGDIHPCFWHPRTSIYTPLSDAERTSSWGCEIKRVVAAIAKVSEMAIFSTELALTCDGRLVAVDYVNDMCDLRPASQCPDGVPDAIVDCVATRLVQEALAAKAVDEMKRTPS